MSIKIEFTKYSDLPKEERDKFNFLNIKRLVLRLEQDEVFGEVLNYNDPASPLNFSLKYFDIENEVLTCFFYDTSDYYGMKRRKREDFLTSITDLFSSMYEQDRSFFQTFFSFMLNEIKEWLPSKSIEKISPELQILGYTYDGNILKTSSGDPIISSKINTILEDQLKKINPDLLKMRDGAIQSLLSNKPDKFRHVSSSCRALLNTFLKELVPKVDLKDGESEIKKRIEKLFSKSDSTCGLVNETVNLIQSLNKVQCKGDHSSINESLSYFIFEITEKIIYFILTNKK